MLIDVGNTRLKWAMYQTTDLNAQPIAHECVFLERVGELSEKSWIHLPEPKHVLACCVASQGVKSSIDEQLEIWSTPAQWVTAKREQCGIRNSYDHPVRLGADRWMALIGARQHLHVHNNHGPALVVMIGTAVTVDALDGLGNFLGGLIMPGHGIMLNALRTGTAGLHVPTGQVCAFPTNTNNALTTGGTYAITGAIEHMAVNLHQQTQQVPQIILTGGAAWKIKPYLTIPAELIESLIFDGMMAVAAENWPEDYSG